MSSGMLSDNKLIFSNYSGIGFWSWSNYKDLIILQEEMGFGVFNLDGEQLWESHVEPP
jgi:hypothetical protein